MEYINYVKQQPIQGISGFGGGANSLAFKGASGPAAGEYSLDFDEGDGMSLSGSNIDSEMNLQGNFCVECFFKITSFGDNTYRALFNRFSSNDYQWQTHVRTDAAGGFKMHTWFQFNDNQTVAGNHIQLNQWTHYAFVRDSNNLYQYINGVERSGGGWTSSVNPTGGVNEPFAIAHRIDSGSYDFIGKMSNVRYTVGQAVYTSGFTPSTTPLTTTSQSVTASNCKFLGAQGATIGAYTDAPSGSTWASGTNNDPTVSEDSPF